MGNREPNKKNAPRAQGAESARDSKSAKSGKRGRQKGPQPNAEGQHGSKTRRRFIEQLHEPEATMKETAANRSTRGESVDNRRDRGRARRGEHRLVEDRQQHDEAEKNSERTRLFVEYERGRPGANDVRGNLHGVLGHREHRADHKERDRDGLRSRD